MKCASIDIGTNTLRLLVAEVDAGGSIEPVVYERVITRLGGGFTDAGGIDRASGERALKALDWFSAIIENEGATRVRAVATSVVRRAVNREGFLAEIASRTGIEVEVIDGDEEARLSLLGVSSVVNTLSDRLLVMDIGGGSTEFIASYRGSMAGGWSMEMGVVHLTERHLLSDPPSGGELLGMEGEIRGVIEGLKARMASDGVSPEDYSEETGAAFVGTAGTVTTLAAIDLDLEEYDRDLVNNHVIGKSKVLEIYNYLKGLTLEKREDVLSLEKGREDLIIPGTAIVLAAMEAFGFRKMIVSDAGLLEGVLIEAFTPGG